MFRLGRDQTTGKAFDYLQQNGKPGTWVSFSEPPSSYQTFNAGLVLELDSIASMLPEHGTVTDQG